MNNWSCVEVYWSDWCSSKCREQSSLLSHNSEILLHVSSYSYISASIFLFKVHLLIWGFILLLIVTSIVVFFTCVNGYSSGVLRFIALLKADRALLQGLYVLVQKKKKKRDVKSLWGFRTLVACIFEAGFSEFEQHSRRNAHRERETGYSVPGLCPLLAWTPPPSCVISPRPRLRSSAGSWTPGWIRSAGGDWVRLLSGSYETVSQSHTESAD